MNCHHARIWFALGVTAALLACTEFRIPTKGDLDGDGHLTRADMDRLLDLIRGGSDDSAGDLNGDGKVDEADLDVMKELLCKENGGGLTSDGECCTTAEDGTTCCDRNFDGNFNICEPPDTDCTEDQDCEQMSCIAYCSPQGKCQCRGMCDDDGDCANLMTCAAFCTANGECRCKIECEDNDDCLFISHCQSICTSEGFCDCQPPDCLKQGELLKRDDPRRTCCMGLNPIPNVIEREDGSCVPAIEGGAICAYCGDGLCDFGENRCNCLTDCGGCVIGEERPFTCPDGQQVAWCTCDSDGRWVCILSPERQCNADCHMAGEEFMGEGRCCEGLTQVEDVDLVMNPDGTFTCLYKDCLCFVCIVACGDGVCGEGENACVCPEDCQAELCQPGDTKPCECNFGENPPCWRCSEQGTWVPVEYYADPCLCDMVNMPVILCAEGFVCDSFATHYCVADCRLQGAPLCPDGGVCDPETGLCLKDCVEEGDRFVGIDFENQCCPGLTPVPDLYPDPSGASACTGPNCICFVCTRCGDGGCGLGENLCNCPQDCLDTNPCPDTCGWSLAGNWMVEVSSCAGIPANQNPHQLGQTGCTVAYQDPLAAVFGETGCFEGGKVTTSKGCVGEELPTGLIRFEYTCPDSSGAVCTVLLVQIGK